MLNFVLTAETPEELTEAWDIANSIGYAPGVEDFNRAHDLVDELTAWAQAGE